MDDRNDNMEVIDQLITGPMQLDVLRRVFTSEQRFLAVIASMIADDLLQLTDKDGGPVEHWQVRDVLTNPALWTLYDLDLTAKGIATFRG